MAAYSALFQQQMKTSGEGKCPKGKSHLRYNIKKCNVHKCQGDEVCIAMQDLVISIDGSGSLRENRFKIMEAFMLVKFCPEAISPSTRKVKEGEMGYMLVQRGQPALGLHQHVPVLVLVHIRNHFGSIIEVTHNFKNPSHPGPPYL